MSTPAADGHLLMAATTRGSKAAVRGLERPVAEPHSMAFSCRTHNPFVKHMEQNRGVILDNDMVLCEMDAYRYERGMHKLTSSYMNLLLLSRFVASILIFIVSIHCDRTVKKYVST